MKKSLDEVEEGIRELEDTLSKADGGESVPEFYNRVLSPILGEIDRRVVVLREKIASFQDEIGTISRRMDQTPSDR